MTEKERNTFYNEGVQDILHLVRGSLMVQMVAEDHPLKVVLRELVTKIPQYYKHPCFNAVLMGETNQNEQPKK